MFVLTRAPIASILDQAKQGADPVYDFTSTFGGFSELEGIQNKVWRVPEASERGRAIQAALATEPLYIADGHHRYHASLLNEQTHFLCYVTEEAVMQAYNRVINGIRPFAEIAGDLPLRPVDSFALRKSTASASTPRAAASSSMRKRLQRMSSGASIARSSSVSSTQSSG